MVNLFIYNPIKSLTVFSQTLHEIRLNLDMLNKDFNLSINLISVFGLTSEMLMTTKTVTLSPQQYVF